MTLTTEQVIDLLAQNCDFFLAPAHPVFNSWVHIYLSQQEQEYLTEFSNEFRELFHSVYHYQSSILLPLSALQKQIYQHSQKPSLTLSELEVSFHHYDLVVQKFNRHFQQFFIGQPFVDYFLSENVEGLLPIIECWNRSFGMARDVAASELIAHLYSLLQPYAHLAPSLRSSLCLFSPRVRRLALAEKHLQEAWSLYTINTANSCQQSLQMMASVKRSVASVQACHVEVSGHGGQESSNLAEMFQMTEKLTALIKDKMVTLSIHAWMGHATEKLSGSPPQRPNTPSLTSSMQSMYPEMFGLRRQSPLLANDPALLEARLALERLQQNDATPSCTTGHHHDNHSDGSYDFSRRKAIY